MDPHSFQIEPVEGCTRRCDFCGINQFKNPNKMKFMTLKLGEHIASQIASDFKPKIRVDFAVHGEPMMHPNLSKLISIFRKYLPKAQLTVISNGDPLFKKPTLVEEIFASGLNNLMVDFYDNHKTRNDHIRTLLKESGVVVLDFYKDNVHPWTYKSATHQQIIVTEALDVRSGEKLTRKVHSAGGNLDRQVWRKYGIKLNDFPKMTRCAKPFRELTINHDGNVSICCEDWRRQQEISNVLKERIRDIWDGEMFSKYRYLLYNKRRDLIEICRLCNEVSFRVGLLKIDKEYPELIEKKEIL